MTSKRRSPDEPSPDDRLSQLADYLRTEVDPHDFEWLLPEYISVSGADDAGFDPDEPWEFLSTPRGQRLLPGFEAWLRSVVYTRRDVADDPYSPAYLAFGSVSDPTGAEEWLVHFSDDAEDIASHGFKYGQPDERLLALTTHFSDAVRRKEPGWNFGFEAGSPEAYVASRRSKYGRHAVLFRARHVLAMHYGDMERQAIFWGPSVSSSALLKRDGSRWSVRLTTGGEACGGDFSAAVTCGISRFGAKKGRVFRRAKKA